MAAFLAGIIFPNPASGADPAAASPPESAPTVRFEYAEASYDIMNVGVGLSLRSAPFPKEPTLGRGKSVRGTLQFGGAVTNAMAFVWDQSARTLYLDLNRNQDLTDDAAGVFVARERMPTSYHVFTNISLSLSTSTGNRAALMNLTFVNYPPRPQCTAALRSFWQGKLTLQGRDYQVGILENPSSGLESLEHSELLLRPWEDRNRPFSQYSGSLDAFAFSRKLFISDHAYQLDWMNAAPGDEPKPELRFTEQQPALGELRINGSFIQRAILENGPYLVVLDRPAAVVKIPVGRYPRHKVRLENGETGAYPASGLVPAASGVSVDEKRPAVLAIGGPLTNSVTATRHGRSLLLNYQLIGAGGEAYQLQTQDRSRPPQFAVFRGETKIASGKFEFG